MNKDAPWAVSVDFGPYRCVLISHAAFSFVTLPRQHTFLPCRHTLAVSTPNSCTPLAKGMQSGYQSLMSQVKSKLETSDISSREPLLGCSTSSLPKTIPYQIRTSQMDLSHCKNLACAAWIPESEP